MHTMISHASRCRVFAPSRNAATLSNIVVWKPKQSQQHQKVGTRAFIWTDPVTTSYFVGKGIILYTMFYCTMNWWFYKRTREDLENDENDKDDQN